ncbi:hypothetical protein [Streptomyces nogalater]|uniref:Polysaccharide lyase 8 N-terminal alpha-helical domain-containing protein n=2 Tax=Streptomyces nogalater TaxID=38314 RepID=A0ABW0WWB6_STRNO
MARPDPRRGFRPRRRALPAPARRLGGTTARYLATMAPAAGSRWPDLVYADGQPGTDRASYDRSSRLDTSYARLSTLGQSCCWPGTGLTGDPRVRDALLTGLGHPHDDVYHAGQARYGNWYD